MPLADVCIAGAGIIGLSLARSLAHAGLRVLVLTRGHSLDEASTAAAGMLAVDDPDNPAALLPLSRLSRSLYPNFLAELSTETNPVSVQTRRTLQFVSEPTPSTIAAQALLADLAPTTLPALDLVEDSLDPRELAAALLAFVSTHPRIDLRLHTPVHHVTASTSSVTLHTTTEEQFHAAAFVDCTGAWSLSSTLVPSLRVAPRKGQMLTIPTPPSLAREALVLRSHTCYLVPRLHGPRAGHCVLGATVEDLGFDRTVHPASLQHLLSLAAELLPSLESAPVLSSWAGLRPATADSLPILGRLAPPDTEPHTLPLFVASGHFRNGILLAPATASVLSDLILHRPPAIDLTPFSPARFYSATTATTAGIEAIAGPSVV